MSSLMQISLFQKVDNVLVKEKEKEKEKLEEHNLQQRFD